MSFFIKYSKKKIPVELLVVVVLVEANRWADRSLDGHQIR